jgi:hypothetical protein
VQCACKSVSLPPDSAGHIAATRAEGSRDPSNSSISWANRDLEGAEGASHLNCPCQPLTGLTHHPQTG